MIITKTKNNLGHNNTKSSVASFEHALRILSNVESILLGIKTGKANELRKNTVKLIHDVNDLLRILNIH